MLLVVYPDYPQEKILGTVRTSDQGFPRSVLMPFANLALKPAPELAALSILTCEVMAL